MLRKKITNKEKFQFREDEVLSPLPTKGRNSFQSRLARKADDNIIHKLSRSEGFGCQTKHHDVVKQEGLCKVGSYHVKELPPPMLAKHQMTGSPDPVLDEIVAKLKSGLQLGYKTQMPGATSFNMASNPKPVIHKIPPLKQDAVSSTRMSQEKFPPVEAVSTTRLPQKTCPPAAGCICLRPLKLVMCEMCGETFCARVALVCSIHPRAMYLHDVKECKGCKQTNMQALKEFDLPPGPGMEKGIKNAVGRKNRGLGMN